MISLHQIIIHNHYYILSIVYFHLMENIMYTESSSASIDMIFNIWNYWIWACILFGIIQCWENFTTAAFTFTMGSSSSSRWDFHFHSYVLTIYVCLYWILELVVFTLLYVGGKYARLVYNWYRNIFHTFA